MLIGKIDHIDFVSKMGLDGKQYNAAYIHFKYWYNTVTAFNFQERVLDPTKEARVVYEDPWYWIVLENKSHKRVSGQRKKCLDIGDMSSSPVEMMRKINIEDVFASASKRQLERVPSPDIFTDEEKEDEFINEMEILEAESDFIISIDSRYVQELEQENVEMRLIIDQLKWQFMNNRGVECEAM
jgi:hypothetical protein